MTTIPPQPLPPTRITESMSVRDAIVALADGLPEALDVLVRVYQVRPMALFSLDFHRIYGEQIWDLYLKSGEDIDKMLDALKGK